MRWQFESLADFGRQVKESGIHAFHSRGEESCKDWTGETFQESIHNAINGDVSKVAEAEALLERVNAAIELPSRQWQTDVVGFFPSVPDYIAGHPECMRRITDAPSEHAPIRVFVSTTSSAQVDWKDLQKRGVSILACVMALSRSRPVELWTFTAMQGNAEGFSNVMVKINSNPLQLSEACYALCSIGFDRNLTHAWGGEYNRFNGGWPHFMYSGDFVEHSRRILGDFANDNDIIIPPTHAKHTEIIANPLAWVNKTLARFQTEQEFA